CDAADGDREHEEQRQLAVLERRGGKIEPPGAHLPFATLGPAALSSSSRTFTCCPARIRLAPAMTTTSPRLRPDSMSTRSPDTPRVFTSTRRTVPVPRSLGSTSQTCALSSLEYRAASGS